MNSHASHFERGDKVLAPFGLTRVPARVIGLTEEEEYVSPSIDHINLDDQESVRRIALSDPEVVKVSRVRVAFSLPHEVDFVYGRTAPVGTPVFWNIDPEKVELQGEDPHWNPYGVMPFMTPSDYQVISGVPRSAGFTYPMSHVGAYMSTRYYSHSDPVWVWESRWVPAVVKNVDPRWVSVTYCGGYRNRKGDHSKSYKSSLVWPAICDFPEAITELTLRARRY